MHVISKNATERGKEPFLQRLAVDEGWLLVQQNGYIDIAVWPPETVEPKRYTATTSSNPESTGRIAWAMEEEADFILQAP